GRVLVNLGQKEAAQASFRELVELRPSHTIDRATTSPKIVDLFDAIRRPRVGALRVTSAPIGALVSLDGRRLGTTDLTTDVLVGVHELTVTRAGYAPETRSVTVDAKGTLPVEV